MYSTDSLNKYEYFKKILKDNKIEYILDPLTGIIGRKYILDFIRYLIKNNEPFTMAILDLDNFKEINDNYGHATGDRVLENIGSDLINYMGGDGLVGRFGGDEFIIIIFGHTDYEKIHKYYKGMYLGTVLRKTFKAGKNEIFITGTIGSASFPHDGKSYDELFAMSDKTLYRGKDKGRNCYIIYVHEKHKDLEINKLANDDEATVFFNIHSIFNDNYTFNEKMIDVDEYLKKNLKMNFICYIDKDNNIYNLDNMKIVSNNVDLSKLKFNNELIKTDMYSEIEKLNKELYDSVKQFNGSSLLITRLRKNDKVYGYLLFGLERAFKIWKNEEIATLMYLGKNILLELIK